VGEGTRSVPAVTAAEGPAAASVVGTGVTAEFCVPVQPAMARSTQSSPVIKMMVLICISDNQKESILLL
jgi:hypothetical protein